MRKIHHANDLFIRQQNQMVTVRVAGLRLQQAAQEKRLEMNHANDLFIRQHNQMVAVRVAGLLLQQAAQEKPQEIGLGSLWKV
jgi:hypothetical protein